MGEKGSETWGAVKRNKVVSQWNDAISTLTLADKGNRGTLIKTV